MKTIEVRITAAALRSMAEGQSFEIEIPGELLLVLACDADMVTSFREHIDRAMLDYLPTGTTKH